MLNTIFSKEFKKAGLVLALISMLVLTACSGSTSSASAQSSNSQRTQSSSTTTVTPETRLALGTLKLEGTNQALTADQAKTLLPLWKAVKSLSANSASSPIEVQALFDQIKENMTVDQTQAIDKLDLSAENLRTIMTSLGIQGGAAGGGQRPSSTQSAGGANAGQQRQGGQNFGGGGGGIPGGGFPGGNGGANTGQRSTTPGAGTNGTSTRNRVNPALVDAIIKLLEGRASS
jgi:hypothetical protein